MRARKDGGNCLTRKRNLMKQSRIKGREAEKIAVEWLKKRGFIIHYWHKGRASNKPYDILAEKGRERWAIDVKTGEKTGINLKRFRELLEKKELEYMDEETKEKHKFRHNIIGYAIIIGKDVFLFGYNKYKWRAIKAWKTIRKE